MTLEAYLNGSRIFRINNFVATAEGQSDSNGTQIDGEWLEVKVRCEHFYANWRPNGGWLALYHATILSLPTHARLDHSEWSSSGTEEGYSYPSETYSYVGNESYIGPGSNLGVRDYTNPNDEEWDYIEYHPATGEPIERTANVRATLKLYFVKISHIILRDPQTNNIILRASEGGTILRDA